jgi:hypothetical protein
MSVFEINIGSVAHIDKQLQQIDEENRLLKSLPYAYSAAVNSDSWPNQPECLPNTLEALLNEIMTWARGPAFMAAAMPTLSGADSEDSPPSAESVAAVADSSASTGSTVWPAQASQRSRAPSRADLDADANNNANAKCRR